MKKIIEILLMSMITLISFGQGLPVLPTCTYWPEFDETRTASLIDGNDMHINCTSTDLVGPELYSSWGLGYDFLPDPMTGTSNPPNLHPHNTATPGVFVLYPVSGQTIDVAFDRATTTGFYMHIYQTVSTINFSTDFTLVAKDDFIVNSVGSTSRILNNSIEARDEAFDANATLYFPPGTTSFNFTVISEGTVFHDGIKFCFVFPDDCYTPPHCDSIHASFTHEGTNPVTFTDNSTYRGTVNGYIWNFGDGTTETTNLPEITHTYTTMGTFTVCHSVLIEDNGFQCCDIICDTIHINTDTNNICVANVRSDIHIEGLTIDFSDASIINQTLMTSIWVFGDGTEPFYGTSGTHTYEAGGTYVVGHYIYVSSPDGPCCGFRYDTIVIDGGKTLTKTKGASFGSNVKNKNFFKVVPNPADDEINLLYNYTAANKNGIFKLNSLDGNSVLDQKINMVDNAPINISTFSLPNGMYTYQWITEDGVTLTTGKLQIIHE